MRRRLLPVGMAATIIMVGLRLQARDNNFGMASAMQPRTTSPSATTGPFPLQLRKWNLACRGTTTTSPLRVNRRRPPAMMMADDGWCTHHPHRQRRGSGRRRRLRRRHSHILLGSTTTSADQPFNDGADRGGEQRETATSQPIIAKATATGRNRIRGTMLPGRIFQALSLPPSFQRALVGILTGSRPTTTARTPDKDDDDKANRLSLSSMRRPGWARTWMPTWLTCLRPSVQLFAALLMYMFHSLVLNQTSVPLPFQLIPNERGNFQSVGLDS
jgi:hypothetical protein